MVQLTQPKGMVSKETNKEAIARVFGLKKREVGYLSTSTSVDSYTILYDEDTQTCWYRGSATGTPTSWNISGQTLTLVTNIDTFSLTQGLLLPKAELQSNQIGYGASLIGTTQGGNLQQFINYITLEAMGKSTDDEAFDAAINLQKLTGYPILLGWKTYTLNSSKIYTDLFDVTILGMGKGRSILNLTHLTQGLRFGPESDAGTKAQLTLKGFTLNRVNYANYTGTIGPKNLYVSNRDSVFIEDVEVIGNIGYGIQTDYSENIIINACHVKNALGGYLAQKAGTDGIHLYRSNKARVTNCYTYNLGDDGFSCGSFNTAYPAYDIVFENNTIYQCAGGFKAYSLVQNVKYSHNTVDTTLQGAFYLTNDANSINGAYVKNINIHHNFIVNAQDTVTPTNVESGALRIRCWADNATANATGSIDNVRFTDNICENCAVMVSHVTFDEYKRLSNLYICNNIFRSPSQINATNRPAIRLIQCDYGLDISDNNFSSLLFGAIAVDFSYLSFTSAGSRSPRWKIYNNIIRGYNLGQTLVGDTSPHRAIFIRESGFHLVLNMVGNKITDGALTDGVTPTQSIFTGTVSPLSYIEGNTSDLSQNISGGSGAYKGIIKYITSTPSSGTHYRNSHLQTSNPTASTLNDYICYQDGTYGTLSSVTATTTSGSRTIIVNDASNLYVGCVLNIAGVTGRLTVSDISGTTITLSTTCDASVSSAAVSFVPPAWRVLSWSTTTPTTSAI